MGRVIGVGFPDNFIWRNVDGYLVRWVRRKYKRFSGHKRRAWQYLRELAQANPKLFVQEWPAEIRLLYSFVEPKMRQPLSPEKYTVCE